MPRLLAGLFAVAAVLGLLGGPFVAPGRADEGPAPAKEVVGRWQAALLDTMRKADALGHAGRIEQLGPVLDQTHDLGRMAQERVGEAWGGLTPEQRTMFSGLYRKAMLAALAGTASRYRGESFTQRGESAEGDTMLVKTVQIRGSTKRAYDYRLRRRDGRWWIIDRITAGKSDLARTGAAYKALLAEGGFEALVARLESDVRLATETPSQVVARLQDSVVDVLKKGKGLGYRGRFEQFAPVIASTHDLTGMGQLAVRRFWKRWTTTQKQQYLTAFRELSIAYYASEFRTYGGETFALQGEQKVKTSVVVRTVVTRSNGETNQLDYFLRKVKGMWRIVNIRADGVSGISTQQSSYTKTLSSKGFPALLDKIRSKIRSLASAGS